MDCGRSRALTAPAPSCGSVAAAAFRRLSCTPAWCHMVRAPPFAMPCDGLACGLRAAGARHGASLLTSSARAACTTLAALLDDDTLRAALLPERAAAGTALTKLASVPWSQAEYPTATWAIGIHVSSQAPALMAVLLGDVERDDGAQGGVALSAAAVGALVLGAATAFARPSSSGSMIWPVWRRAPWRVGALRVQRAQVRRHLNKSRTRAGRSCTRFRASA